MSKLPEGISPRHLRSCPSRTGKACRCKPSYQAQIFDRRTRQRRSRTFPTLAAAKAWRRDALSALQQGRLAITRSRTVNSAAQDWLQAASAGTIRNRSGDIYKPSVIRNYELALRLRVLPALGNQLLTDIRRSDLQRLVNRWMADAMSPSTVRNTLNAIRVIYRYAISLDEVTINPTTDLELPAVRSQRDRFANPEEAVALIAAAPERDRLLWSAAFYTGLRLGELRALMREDVDLANGRIRVNRSWDIKEGEVKPKSRAGRRVVPIIGELREELVGHFIDAPSTGLLFPATQADRPFDPKAALKRARRSWAHAGLEPLTFQDCRHTFASLLIAAGVNAKAITSIMGHASVTVTFDRYGHMLPGSEQEAGELLQGYLNRSVSKPRIDAAAQ